MPLLRLYFAIDVGYTEYRNQLDKHRNPGRYNWDDRQIRRRRGTLISYSPTEAYGVHTPGIVYVQAPTTATCTRMLTERACPEINLVLGDIARGLPAVDRSRDRWIIDRYSEPAGGCSVLLCDSLVQHVCARVYCNVYACGTCSSSQKIAEDTWVMFEPVGNRIDRIHFSISLSEPSVEKRFERSGEAFFGRWNRNPFVAFAGHVRRSRASYGWEFWSSVARFAFWLACFRSFASGRVAVKNGSNDVALRNEICEFVIVERSIFVASSWGYCEKRVKPWKLLRNSTKTYKRATTR